MRCSAQADDLRRDHSGFTVPAVRESEAATASGADMQQYMLEWQVENADLADHIVLYPGNSTPMTSGLESRCVIICTKSSPRRMELPYCTLLYYNRFYYTALYCIILYYTILYYNILYYITLQELGTARTDKSTEG